MRIDEMVSALQADFATWVAGVKGKLSIARDPWNVLEILCEGPQGLQVILHWNGDEPAGDLSQDPLSNNALEVIVGYNLGLNAQQDDALIVNRTNRPSLLKFVTDARARLLTYKFAEDVTEQFLEYAGTEPVTLPDGMPLAAYRIRARLTARVDTDEEYRSAV